jgi:hypothetical protein
MTFARLCLVLALGWLPAQAFGLCYTVIGQNGVVVWRGSNSPIDLSGSVTQGMRRVFPTGNQLVISYDTTSCTPIGPADNFGAMPGFSGPLPGATGWQSGMTADPRRK